MERPRDNGRQDRTDKLRAGPSNTGETLGNSIRIKILEFEREREAYISTAKEMLLLPETDPLEASRDAPLRTSGIGQREVQQDSVARGVEEEKGEGRRRSMPHLDNDGTRATAGAEVEKGVGGREKPMMWRPVPSVLAAREERRAATEELRLLHQRKADAVVRLQGERLSNLEQTLELETLRLERLLDRERILELLRLTDPNVQGPRPPGGSLEGEGEVSMEAIQQLEDRVKKAEEQLKAETSRLGSAVAMKLGERARREDSARQQEAISSEEVVRLQTALREKEQKLARTIVDYLELRHAVLRAQRVSSEAREEAAAARIAEEEEIQKCERDVAELRRSTKEEVDKTCEAVSGQLRRQIQLREDEACMLREQRAEVEELYEARAARLEGLIEEWKAKYASLRRRFALETEGFRRDADEIGRRFERVQVGPSQNRRRGASGIGGSGPYSSDGNAGIGEAAVP